MRILMLLSKPFQPEPWIYREAKTLVDAGHHVKIIGWNRDRKYKNAEILDGIEINRVSIRAPYGTFIGLLPLYPIFYLVIFFKSFFIDFDVIDCHNFDTLPLGLLIGKIRRKKVIYHCLDLYFTWFSRETSSKVKNYLSILFRRFEAFFLKYIDHLIVTAPGYIDYYKKYGLKCENTVVLNTPSKNFVKLNSYKKSKDKKNQFVISYIGEVRYEKSLINLIKATEKIDDVKVLIVGGGVKAECIKEKAKSYNHVSIVGQVPYKEVIKYYIQSDCTFAVYDSSVENIKIAIPVKVFESMACGIPMIVNKNIWISDFVEKNRIGLCIDENNIKEIESSILDIKKNINLTKEFGMNGRKLFEEVYNWENQEKKLIKLYNELIKN